MGKPTLIIADQDSVRRVQVSRNYSGSAAVHECSTMSSLVKLLSEQCPAVVLVGSMSGGATDGIEAAHHVRGAHPAAKVILVADHSSEAIAIGALRAGVADYLRPPIAVLEIIEAIDKLLPSLDDSDDSCDELTGQSPVMRELKDLIKRIAPMNSTVLITGETGTGKEVVARLLHRLSPRAKAALVCVNCAAIPDTLLESDLFGHETGAFTGAVRRQPGQIQMADGGTLFLDEIGDMSTVAQSKLLRVIEQREVRPLGKAMPSPVNIRLVAATHRRLEDMLAQETFREDLFFRINVARIHVPPLRERIEDVPALARRFLAELGPGAGRRIESFTKGAMQRLLDYDWPGNVRELRNTVETAIVMCRSDQIGEEDLQARHSGSLGMPMQRAASSTLASLPPGPEIDRLMQALRATNWNVAKTARMLHWSRMTVYRKVAKYGVERPTGADGPAQGDAGADEQAEEIASCQGWS